MGFDKFSSILLKQIFIIIPLLPASVFAQSLNCGTMYMTAVGTAGTTVRTYNPATGAVSQLVALPAVIQCNGGAFDPITLRLYYFDETTRRLFGTKKDGLVSEETKNSGGTK